MVFVLMKLMSFFSFKKKFEVNVILLWQVLFVVPFYLNDSYIASPRHEITFQEAKNYESSVRYMQVS